MPKDELTTEEIDAMGADEIAKVEVDTETGVASITPEQQTQILPEKPEKLPEAPAAGSKPEKPATTDKPAGEKQGDKAEATTPPGKPDDKPEGPDDSKAKTEETDDKTGTKPKEEGLKPDPLKDPQFHHPG